ncbi:MAG: histidine phosphatase family protein [Desulfobacterales bacterium]|nr:histidine phosphatase family protein [Desulfobacterales bacterium]
MNRKDQTNLDPRGKTTLLVIRHGQTVWNVQQRYQGHGDSPLTEEGRNQAEALGRRMRRIHFDALISSDLGRTLETARIIARHTGHDISMDSRLRERNFGVLEGLTAEEINSRFPKVYDKLHANDPDYVIPEGESLRQHYGRNIQFIETCTAENAGKTIALVAHGGVLDSILRYITGFPLDHPRCFTAANTSLNIFSHGLFYGTCRWVIETWGDVSHLNADSH